MSRSRASSNFKTWRPKNLEVKKNVHEESGHSSFWFSHRKRNLLGRIKLFQALDNENGEENVTYLASAKPACLQLEDSSCRTCPAFGKAQSLRTLPAVLEQGQIKLTPVCTKEIERKRNRNGLFDRKPSFSSNHHVKIASIKREIAFFFVWGCTGWAKWFLTWREDWNISRIFSLIMKYNFLILSWKFIW